MIPPAVDKTLRVTALLLTVFFVFGRNLAVHGVEYRDDEIFYYQSTQEMWQKGQWLSPTYFGQDRFQKPILYYWFVLISYYFFGINWFAARLVAVIFATLTVWMTWRMTKELFDQRTADLGALVLMTFPLFFRHAKDAVPDMPLNFFIVWAMWAFIRVWRHQGTSLWFFAACGLGFMVKGFAAWIVPMGTALLFMLVTRDKDLWRRMRFGRGLLLTLAIVLPWFIFMVKTHGRAYLDYMLIHETKDRLVGGPEAGSFWSGHVGVFIRHMGFYLRVLLSYFAPWSVFGFMSIAVAMVHARLRREIRAPLILMLLWIGVVFFFFSSMYFTINHYMLVLSTPLAVLTAYFLLCPFQEGKRRVRVFNKGVMLVTLTVGAITLGVLFLMGNRPAWWGVVLAGAYGLSACFIHASRRPGVPPTILAVFLLALYAQSDLIGEVGLTSHAVLQRLAGVVHSQKTPRAVVGVGSHDIHEKEFQVYFKDRVIKAATSDEDVTRQRIRDLFGQNKTVYCLLTEEDYRKYLADIPVEVIAEAYIVRRRMAIDKRFFEALAGMKRSVVRRYLMEKIVLVKKDGSHGIGL